MGATDVDHSGYADYCREVVNSVRASNLTDVPERRYKPSARELRAIQRARSERRAD